MVVIVIVYSEKDQVQFWKISMWGREILNIWGINSLREGGESPIQGLRHKTKITAIENKHKRSGTRPVDDEFFS